MILLLILSFSYNNFVWELTSVTVCCSCLCEIGFLKLLEREVVRVSLPKCTELLPTTQLLLYSVSTHTHRAVGFLRFSDSGPPPTFMHIFSLLCFLFSSILIPSPAVYPQCGPCLGRELWQVSFQSVQMPDHSGPLVLLTLTPLQSSAFTVGKISASSPCLSLIGSPYFQVNASGLRQDSPVLRFIRYPIASLYSRLQTLITHKSCSCKWFILA